MEQLTIVKKKSKCHFCGTSKNDYLKYGPTYKLGNVTAHYYCLLLSNRLIQNGNDDEGILGFLLSDITNELNRTSSILCTYCQRGNASIACAATKCNRTFHLPCGLNKGSLHQFVNQFKSFCHRHRPTFRIPEKILRDAFHSKIICCICQEKVDIKIKRDVLWAPCCRKTWYHRMCVQKFAYSAGYFCRCPACNDVKKFNELMQRCGIFIPQQDASWELVPNAFEELLFRYNKCDAKHCKCPGGRQRNTENTMWEIILCESCGSQGIHVKCGNLKFLDPEWECPICEEITKNVKSATEISNSSKADEGSSKQLKRPEVGQKKRRRSSEELENSVLDKRKKFKKNVEEDEEEEIDIDVETVDEGGKDDETLTEAVDKSKDVEKTLEEMKEAQKKDLQEVLSVFKPGPLSYKLSLLRKVAGDVLIPSEGKPEGNEETSSSGIDLIDLSISDEEKETDSDVEVIKEVTDKRSKVSRCEAPCCDVTSYEEIERGQEFSLMDIKMVGVVSLKPAEKEGDCSRAMALSQRISPTVIESRISIARPTTFFEESKIFLVYPGQQTEAAVKENKTLVKPSDDDVIILTD